MCVGSLSYPAWNALAPHGRLWSVGIYNIFPHFLKKTRYSKNVVEYKICVLIFSTTFVWKFSHSKKWTRYDKKCTGLFKVTVVVLTTCHTQYTWDSSICIFLFNWTTLQVFVTYFTGAVYVHPLWFYRHQHENRVCSNCL